MEFQQRKNLLLRPEEVNHLLPRACRVRWWASDGDVLLPWRKRGGRDCSQVCTKVWATVGKPRPSERTTCRSLRCAVRSASRLGARRRHAISLGRSLAT